MAYHTFKTAKRSRKTLAVLIVCAVIAFLVGKAYHRKTQPVHIEKIIPIEILEEEQ